MDELEHRILALQVEILDALHSKCHLSQIEISRLIEEQALLDYISDSYEIFHIQGIYGILEDIQGYLSKRGVKIDVEQPGESRGLSWDS